MENSSKSNHCTHCNNCNYVNYNEIVATHDSLNNGNSLNLISILKKILII